MKYDMDSFTYGVELEYSNIDSTRAIADGASWNYKDSTIVNSTGIANDPLSVLYKYGSEINTRATTTIEEQLNHIEQIHKKLVPVPLINYRSSTHIHIRVPELADDLQALKKLLQYIVKYQQEVFDIVETIPVPSKSLEEHVYKAAKKNYHQQLIWKNAVIHDNHISNVLSAKTPHEFYINHTDISAEGKPYWWHVTRAAINLRQLFEETNTIEFRHFSGTTDLAELESCLMWCKLFLYEALHEQRPPHQIVKQYKFKFPKSAEFDYETEEVYQYTSVAYNTRKVVEKRLNILRNKIDIDNIAETTAADVYKHVQHLKKLNV